MQIRLNTDQEYPCLSCGTLGNIIRESSDLEQRRIKCNAPRCGFTYTAADSLKAKEAGQIPNGSPEPQDNTHIDSPDDNSKTKPPNPTKPDNSTGSESTIKAPRTPSFVILSKDRTESEFCTKKNLKQRVIHWTANDRKFDVYELQPKKVAATLSIQ